MTLMQHTNVAEAEYKHRRTLQTVFVEVSVYSCACVFVFVEVSDCVCVERAVVVCT